MGRVPTESSSSPLVGKPAPDLVLGRSDGTTGSVINSRQGKKAILIFWATWCPHCYEELGAINDQMGSIEQKGIKIILVDVGETKEGVQNYFTSRQMKLVSFVDEDSALQGPYRLFGIPTVIFIDDKGRVRNVTHELPSDYETYFSSK